MTTTLGVHGNQVAVPDPYQNVPVPSEQGQGCTRHNYTAKTMVTLDPGVYCGGIGLNASAEPRHLFNRPRKPQRERHATLTGTGVTLVFTSSGNNYASATINGGATVNLTAPATGSTAGIVLFGDRNKRLSR